MTVSLQPDGPNDVHLLVTNDHAVRLLRNPKVVVVVDEPRYGRGAAVVRGVQRIVERLVEPSRPVRRHRRLIGLPIERSLSMPQARELGNSRRGGRRLGVEVCRGMLRDDRDDGHSHGACGDPFHCGSAAFARVAHVVNSLPARALVRSGRLQPAFLGPPEGGHYCTTGKRTRPNRPPYVSSKSLT